MIKVGCSGFPIPLSRYFQAFGAVEIADTQLGIPVAGTMRRWKREAPRGFIFTLIAPATLTETGFARRKEHQELLSELGDFARQLGAQAVVFQGPPSFEPGKANEKSLYSFLGSLPEEFPTAVVDLPSWTAKQIEAATRKRGIAARDPLRDGPPERAEELVYYRLPGPAGRRSRYDEDALSRIADVCRSTEAKKTVCLLANVDMEANGTALVKLLA